MQTDAERRLNVGLIVGPEMAQMGSEVCCNCGIEFAMPLAFQNACRADSKKSFYCPNGHGQHYATSEADKLRRERDRLKQDAARLQDEIREAREAGAAAQRQASAFKGVATRIRNRVQNGVCPCCNRTFLDLARHMASKHPGANVVEFKTA